MKKVVIYIGIAALAWACQKQIPLKQEESTPRIVINSVFAADDTIWVDLSESRDVLYEGQLPKITDGTIKLLDANETTLGTFTHTSEGLYYLGDPKPSVGKTYKLSASASGFDPVIATSETPSIIAITNIDTSRSGVDDRLQIDITLDDDPNQKNYYAVAVAFYELFDDGLGGEVWYESPYFSTKEISVINGEADIDGLKYGTEFFFSDATFNGQSFTFTGFKYINPFASDGSYLVISLKSLSEDLFKYKLSYSNYIENQGNPFSEPVQVYSNVEDGFGIFGGWSAYRDTLTFL